MDSEKGLLGTKFFFLKLQIFWKKNSHLWWQWLYYISALRAAMVVRVISSPLIGPHPAVLASDWPRGDRGPGAAVVTSCFHLARASTVNSLGKLLDNSLNNDFADIIIHLNYRNW